MTMNDQHAQHIWRRLREVRPLTHCLTNEVVNELTANVLVCAGASPAMVVSTEEVADFQRIASCLLVNLGTPTPDRLTAFYRAVDSANLHQHPWVLDPVAAGATPWRLDLCKTFSRLHPTVIRGNASEIASIGGDGPSGRGVDSTLSSTSAVETAKSLAKARQCTVFMTGVEDIITDGHDVIYVKGGHVMATDVIGTGCSLSALTAAMVAAAPTPLEGAFAASVLAKRAAEQAYTVAKGPGTFKGAYLDAIYQLTQG